MKKTGFSNELKMGIFLSVIFVVFFMSYTFIKNKKSASNHLQFNAVFDHVNGIGNNSLVKYKGLTVGYTGNPQKLDPQANKINVPLHISETDLLIPKNSVAILKKASSFNFAEIEIQSGNDTMHFLKNNDTILSLQFSENFLDKIEDVNSFKKEITKTAHSLDSVLSIIITTLDPTTRAHFKNILENLEKTTTHLKKLNH